VQYAFHLIGNVNWIGAVNQYQVYDEVISILDGTYIRNAFGTNPSFPHGNGPDQWNVDCDFDFSNTVFATDLYLWGANYGRTKG